MSLTLPSELAWVLNMLGFMWPEADEDKLRASAQAWRDFGADLVRVNQNARLVAAQVSTENTADSIDSFDRFWHGVGGRGGDFDKAKEATDHMATALDLTAGLVEGVKLAIIAQLGLLAAEIIVDQVAAPVTLGLSEGAMVGEVILTRVIVRKIIQEGIHKVGHEVVHSLKGRVLDLFRRILATAVRRALVGATVAGGMDIAKQEADVHIFHSRRDIDFTEVAGAAGTGAVVGVVTAPGRHTSHSPTRDVSRPPGPLWTATEFKGIRVYQRDGLIDPKRVGNDGRTNLERMQEGDAPLGPDGKSMPLHHMGQCNDCPRIELTQTLHQAKTHALHINPNSWGSAIDRKAFNTWREEYWMNRAHDFE